MAVDSSELTAQIVAAIAARTWLDPRPRAETSLWELDAAHLVSAVLDAGKVGGRPGRLRIRGAGIHGDVDLSGVVTVVTCEFESCVFERALQLRQASLPALRFRGGELPGLSANQIHVAGDIELSAHVQVLGPIHLAGARVDGSMEIVDATLHGNESVALDCDRITVGENFLLGEPTTLGAAFRLDNAYIKGNLTCRARVSHPVDRSIDANLLRVDGNVTFERGYACAGTLRLAGGNIGGRLHFTGGSVSKGERRDYAIDGENLTVAQNVDLDGRMEIDGPIYLPFAQLGAQLCLEGVRLHAPDVTALDGQGAEIKGDVFVSRNSDVQGRVDFTGANIKGDLACDHASFHNLSDKAVVAERASVGGSMFFEASRIWGTVDLMGAHVGGDLNCTGAQIHSSGEAILARRASIDKDVQLCTDFVAEGTIDLVRVVVGGSLRFETATLKGPQVRSLDLRGARIVGVFNLLPSTPPQGEVDLRDAQCAVFRDDEPTWPETFLLAGFTYGNIDPEPRVEQRLRWLRRNKDGYSARCYEQLMSVLHSAGREEEARRVALDGQHQRAKTVPLYVRPLYWIWGATVGYGYSLRRLFPWLVGLLTFGTVFFWAMYPTAFTPTSKVVPTFNSFIYSLDILVPVFKFGQSDAWIASGSALYVGWIFTIVGWALAAAIVAGLSQIVRQS